MATTYSITVFAATRDVPLKEYQRIANAIRRVLRRHIPRGYGPICTSAVGEHNHWSVGCPLFKDTDKLTWDLLAIHETISVCYSRYIIKK